MVLIFTLKSLYTGSTYVAGPFDIFATTSGGTTTLIGDNISKSTLSAGVTISGVDDATTGGTVQSVDGTCSNSVVWTLTGGPTFYTFNFSAGDSNPTTACTFNQTVYTLYSEDPILSSTSIVYSDTNLTLFDGGGIFYRQMDNNGYIYQISTFGDVNSIQSCG
jgi:hypothetical protein